MPRAIVPSETLIHTPSGPFYADDLLPEMQSMLKALADIEVRYEREHDRLSRSPESDKVKKRLCTSEGTSPPGTRALSQTPVASSAQDEGDFRPRIQLRCSLRSNHRDRAGRLGRTGQCSSGRLLQREEGLDEEGP